MRLLYALVMLGSPLALYWFVIRPRLGKGITETYTHVDGLWPRLRARLAAFRSFAVFALGAAVAALPELLVAMQMMDWSALPQPWPAYVGTATAIALVLVRAFSTTRAGRPPTQEV